jgi:hypothetical protein
MSAEATGTDYNLQLASRETLEEDLQVVREQLVPQLEQLQAENQALKQGGQMTEATEGESASRSAGYDVKIAPRELLEEDLQIAGSHLLPRIEQLQAENEALRQQQRSQ